MHKPLFVYGPLAAHVSGVPVKVEGYMLGQTDGVLPLAVESSRGALSGVLLDAPWIFALYEALGGQSSTTSEGLTLFTTSQAAAHDSAAWDARWGAILPHALSEIRQINDAATLRRRLPMILSRAQAQANAARSKPTDHRSAAPHSGVDVQARTTTHDGFFLTRSYQLTHPRYDGTPSAPLTREVFVATDAAIVLPYDPVRDRVLLVEQFRMGPYGRGDAHPWVLEPVAGRVDGGEAPEAAARRECEEEAGLRLGALEHIASHYCSPGCSTEYFHCYLGLCDLPELRQGHGGLSTEQEDIRTHVLPYATAAELLTTGEADNGPLILMLLWLAANRSRLRGAA